MRTRKIIKKKMDKILPNVILILVGVCFLLPLLWLLFSAFDPTATQMFKIPKTLTLDNFRSVFSDAANRQGFLNSTIISVSVTAIVLVCSLLAAYPLSRYGMKNAQKISMGMLFMSSIPGIATIVPLYQLFIRMKLVNNTAGIIICMSSGALPYAIWMMKNFLDAVPMDLEEAAWVDGASTIVSMIRITVPLMLPGIFTVGIYTFMGAWGNFFTPFLLLQTTSKMPASVNIYRLFGEHGEVVYGMLAAYSVTYMMPVFILYGLAQKYMSQGFSLGGATKG